MGRVVARSPHLSFIARYVQKSRSVAARHQSPVGHHGGNSSGIPNVGKWVRAEQYEVGNLAGLDCSQRIQAEVARWFPRRRTNDVECRHPSSHERFVQPEAGWTVAQRRIRPRQDVDAGTMHRRHLRQSFRIWSVALQLTIVSDHSRFIPCP